MLMVLALLFMLSNKSSLIIVSLFIGNVHSKAEGVEHSDPKVKSDWAICTKKMLPINTQRCIMTLFIRICSNKSAIVVFWFFSGFFWIFRTFTFFRHLSFLSVSCACTTRFCPKEIQHDPTWYGLGNCFIFSLNVWLVFLGVATITTPCGVALLHHSPSPAQI